MKIDLQITFNDANGLKTIGTDGKILTLATVIGVVLLENVQDMPVSGEQKVDMWQLYVNEIQNKKEANLTPEQAKMIKKRIMAAYSAMVVGPVNQIIKDK